MMLNKNYLNNYFFIFNYINHIVILFIDISSLIKNSKNKDYYKIMYFVIYIKNEIISVVE